MKMIFPIFVIVTLLELYVIISVGDSIGAFNTVVLVVLTAFIGSYLLKQQGISTLQKAQQAVGQGQQPTFEVLEGVIIMVSGILLLTPGFITDTVGLLGLMPWTRVFFLNKFLLKNSQVIFKRKSTFKTKEKDKTIEGDFWED